MIAVRDYTLIQSTELVYAVVIEAALSVLGVGTSPDVPSWGEMLSITGQKYFGSVALAGALPQRGRQDCRVWF